MANAARERVDRRCLAPMRRGTLSFHPNASNTFVGLGPDVGSTTAVGLFNNNCMAFVTLSGPGQRIGVNGDQKHRKCYHQHQLFTPRRHRSSSTRVNDADTGEFYANQKSFPDFSSLGITSPVLLKRLTSKPLGLTRPSAVQAAVFETISRGDDDVIVGAETGESCRERFTLRRGWCVMYSSQRIICVYGNNRIGKNISLFDAIGRGCIEEKEGMESKSDRGFRNEWSSHRPRL